MRLFLFPLALVPALILWPLHTKRHAPPIAAHGLMIEPIQCEKEGGTWFFLGPDNEIGLSSASCKAAFEDWRNEHTANRHVGRI